MSKKQILVEAPEPNRSRDALAELERMFQKQQYKDAVKQAKLINKDLRPPRITGSWSAPTVAGPISFTARGCRRLPSRLRPPAGIRSDRRSA